MKILHVEGGRNLYGGALQVLYLMEGLAARGQTNVLACPQGSDLARAGAPFAEVHAMPMGGDLDLRLVPRLRRCIGRCRPDLVHLHSRIGADVMGGIASRWAGVPAVHTRRVDNPESRWMVALKYRLHERVIAISEGIGNVLLAEGLPRDKLRVVRSAVQWERFEGPCERERVCAELGVPPRARLIGVVAQLIGRKGHRFLIEAMRDLASELPDLVVLFFGKGPEEQDLRQRIAAAGLQDRVRLAGFRRDLPDILPCLDLLVHPATMEGLGVSLLQAACASVPIVASDAGGIPEAVRDGINGLLVPPGNVEALAEAMRSLLLDRELARRMGLAGKELMQREFSVDVMVEGNLAVYREVLAERSREHAD
ncbi:MAG: glycosyltransferase [Pseudomonadota bacterium]|nr:glycosyltransferase [Pseudomonadota bacterium]